MFFLTIVRAVLSYQDFTLPACHASKIAIAGIVVIFLWKRNAKSLLTFPCIQHNKITPAP